MYECIKIIRGYINSPRKQYCLLKDRGLWFQLCSCMDVVEDSELAIAAYSEYSVGKFGNSDGIKYLSTYGMLQALFLQQDSVINLCESLKIPTKFEDYPKLRDIREIRNDSIGHPTKRDRKKGRAKSYHFISRFSLSFGGFDLYSNYSNGQSETKYVSIPKLIADQRMYISDILISVINKLKEEEMNHKKKFKNEKLASIFSSILNYHFGKVSETIYKSTPASFGEASLQYIDETLNTFREALEKRGIEIETYDSINDVFKLVDYPLNELKNFFHNLKSGLETNINAETAYIFAFFVNKQMAELKNFAQEIDEEYSKE